MPFWRFRADFSPQKEGSKSARNPPKRHNAIERQLKKRKKIFYAFSTVVQLLIIESASYKPSPVDKL